MVHPSLYESTSLDLHAILRSAASSPTFAEYDDRGSRHHASPGTRRTAHHAATVRKPATDTAALFARFPHLARLEPIWGSQECRDFVSELIMDTRGGTRQGFPAEHASTIFRLLLEHDTDYPQFEPRATCDWGFGNPR